VANALKRRIKSTHSNERLCGFSRLVLKGEVLYTSNISMERGNDGGYQHTGNLTVPRVPKIESGARRVGGDTNRTAPGVPQFALSIWDWNGTVGRPTSETKRQPNEESFSYKTPRVTCIRSEMEKPSSSQGGQGLLPLLAKNRQSSWRAHIKHYKAHC